MTSKQTPFEQAHDEQLFDQACEITGRFPEHHDFADCVQTVGLVGGLFDRILHVSADGQAERAAFDSGQLETKPIYSVADAEKISKKLRELARSRGLTPVLTVSGLVRRLAPELVALLEDGYSYDEVADALVELGIVRPPLRHLAAL
jgi:hypothetical protein